MKKIYLLLTLFLCVSLSAGAWVVSGSGAVLNGENWNHFSETNTMTELSDGSFQLTVTDAVLEVGAVYEWLITDGTTWIKTQGVDTGSNFTISVTETAKYQIVYTLDNTATKANATVTKTDEAGAVTHTYTVAGMEQLLGSEWDTSDTANDMTQQSDGTYKLVKENLTLSSGAYTYKVAQDHAWGQSWPSQNAVLSISEAGIYTVTFTFNASTKDVGATAKLIQSIQSDAAEGWPANYGGVMMQAFYWDSYEDTAWRTLTAQADTLSKYFDLLWVPNSSNCVAANSMGYLPVYWFDQRSSFGSREKYLREMIAAYKERGTGIIEDVVFNHKSPVGKDGSWIDFANETWTWEGTTYEINWTGADICQNDDGGYVKSQGWPVTGNYDTGDDFSGSRDLDHTSANVQKNCKIFCDYLLKDLGYAGFRLDMVKGYSAEYTKLYNEHSKPRFCVGEYWDGYEAIVNWINNTGRTSAAFDFPLKYVFRDAFGGGNWDALGSKGIAGDPNYNRYAVTFVDNHDTYEKEDRLVNNVLGANAFILAMPGTPCIFLKHWQRYPIGIGNMILARKAAGITNQSSIVDQGSLTGGYFIKVQGNLGTVLCLAGSPQYDTTGFRLIAQGANFAYYVSDNVTVEGLRTGSDDEEQKDIRVYIETTEVPYVYAWSAGNTQLSEAWPGTQLTETEVKEGHTFWTIDFHTVPVNIVINNGAGIQTADITNLMHDSYFTFDATNEDKATNYTDVTSQYYTPTADLPDCAKPIEGHLYAYFQGSKDYDTPYAWVWDDNEQVYCTNTTWPGDKLKWVGTDADGHAVWLWDGGLAANVSSTPTKILFSNNGAPQTADFAFVNGGYYDPTGLQGNAISAVTTARIVPISQGASYNLSGQRVTDNYRGIVVRNGRKIVLR